MNLAIVKRNFILFFILSSLLFSACTKIVTTDIGSGLLPGVDNVTAKDLFMDVVTTNGGDSVAHTAATQDFSLGYIAGDPIFGKTTASINMQLAPTTFPAKFGTYNKDSIMFDSVVLVLSYKGIWGDSFQTMAVRVYQISNDEPFRRDSVYSSGHFFQRGTELTEFFKPSIIVPRNLPDSTYPFSEAATNQIRIRLDGESFGNKLIYGFDTSNAYKNDSIFNQYFRGFQIVPEAQGNALLRVNLQDTNTKLAVYYRWHDAGKIDTAVTYFKSNTSLTAAANTIKRDRSGAEVQNWYPSSRPQDSLLYLEAGPGIFTNVQFPVLTSLSNIIIQRAELLVDQVPDVTFNSDLFLTPPNLFLTTYSTRTQRRFATPGSVALETDSSAVSNATSLGSMPRAAVDPVTGRSHYSYSFDVTQYVQGVVSHNKQAYNFVLFAPGNDFIYAGEDSGVRVPVASAPLNAPAAGRIRVGGGNSVAHKMRLHIVYTQVP